MSSNDPMLTSATWMSTQKVEFQRAFRNGVTGECPSSLLDVIACELAYNDLYFHPPKRRVRCGVVASCTFLDPR